MAKNEDGEIELEMTDIEATAKERGVPVYKVLDEIVNKELDERGANTKSDTILPLSLILDNIVYNNEN